MTAPDESHYDLVASEMLDGFVIPFLGAGANLAERPEETPWEVGVYLPSGSELAEELAERGRYPDDNASDLLRVSQYVGAMLGEGALYRYLHSFFDADYPPNSLHTLLASLPPMLRARGARHQLIVTANYDDAIERAFAAAGEEFDLVWYEAKPRDDFRGRFIHRPPNGEPVVIEQPNDYDPLRLEERTVILKLHGAVDREDAKRDSYVITEDDYIQYLLAYGDTSLGIPKTLGAAMEDSHFLFLGYSMRDWNLRVILNRIWGEQPLDLKSWSVQKAHEDPNQNQIEQTLWRIRGDVDLIQVDLAEYVANLRARVIAATPAEVSS